MCSLNYDLISVKTKGKPIELIKKLNCWASNLNDISLLKELNHLEVLTLSVNQISSLKDIQYCTDLKELYIRDNKISDLDEIFYLKQLKSLKILWLADNECSKDHLYDSAYRLTVIRNLPGLQKLDNSNVTQDEKESALKTGRLILNAPQELSVNECNTTESINSNIYEKVLPVIDSDEIKADDAIDETTHDINDEDKFVRNQEYDNLIDIDTNEMNDLESKTQRTASEVSSINSEVNPLQESNTVAAILILLNDLNEAQLKTISEAIEKRKIGLMTDMVPSMVIE